MCEKRVIFSVCEQQSSIIHRKETINDRSHASSDLPKRDCKRSVLMKQCKTQPLSKTENVKKSLVRNFEQTVTTKTIIVNKAAFRENVPMYGVLKDRSLKSKCNTRYASPELYSTLCVAKRMQQVSEKNDQSKDLMVHSSGDDDDDDDDDDEEKADMGVALKLGSPEVKCDVAKRLDFPPDEPLYMDLVTLDLSDKGEKDVVTKSKYSVIKHSEKEVVEEIEPSSQHVRTPEYDPVYNFVVKSEPRPPSPIKIPNYLMYSATDALNDSIRQLYKSQQNQSKCLKGILEGCKLCKDRDINDPGIFEINPKCYKCMYPTIDLSNDWYTQLRNSCSNKSENNISTSNTFSKKYSGSTEMDSLSSSSCASTCDSDTSSSNSSLLEAGSNYTDRDHGSSFKGMYNSKKSSGKSQRTETGNSGSTSMLKSYCGGNFPAKSQYLETTHSKYSSGTIQDRDDCNILNAYSYKKNSERSVGMGNEVNHSSNGSGENHSDNVTRGYSIHNDDKYSGKSEECVAIYDRFDIDNHRSNDVADVFKDTRWTDTYYNRCNTGKVGGTVSTSIYKTNTNDTFFAKSQGQTEYKKYNIGTSHKRADTGIFKTYNDGKFSMHFEGTEADHRTFKPVKVCDNYSMHFEGTEADHRRFKPIKVCDNDSMYFEGTEADHRRFKPIKVCDNDSIHFEGTEADHRRFKPIKVCDNDSMHFEGTEADHRTFKPIKVCDNDATGVNKLSVQFQGIEGVADHSSSITGNICGTDDTGIFSTESQDIELVSIYNRTNELDRVCSNSGGTGLMKTYTDDKFYAKSLGVETVSNNIYGCHKSFSHAGRIDSTFGYSINRVNDTSHSYSLPNRKQCQIPINSRRTSSRSQILEVNSNDWLSSNSSRSCMFSNSSNETSRNSTKNYDMDTYLDSPEWHSTFADIVSRYSEYGAPWYYGSSRAFTKLLKSRVEEWTSTQTRFSVRQDNRNRISGKVIRHEAEEEDSGNSQNKSEW